MFLRLILGFFSNLDKDAAQGGIVPPPIPPTQQFPGSFSSAFNSSFDIGTI